MKCGHLYTYIKISICTFVAVLMELCILLGYKLTDQYYYNNIWCYCSKFSLVQGLLCSLYNTDINKNQLYYNICHLIL